MCGSGLFQTEPRKWICLNYTEGIKVVAISSIICSVFIIGISSWYLHHSLIAQQIPRYDEKGDAYYRTSYVVRKLEIDYSSSLLIRDFDHFIQLIIWCLCSVLVFGIVQLLTGMWLLWTAKIEHYHLLSLWFLVQLAVIIGIGATYLVLLANEIQITYLVHLVLAFTVIDILILIYFGSFLLCFSDEKDSKKCTNCCSLLWDFDKIIWVNVANSDARASMV